MAGPGPQARPSCPIPHDIPTIVGGLLVALLIVWSEPAHEAHDIAIFRSVPPPPPHKPTRKGHIVYPSGPEVNKVKTFPLPRPLHVYWIKECGCTGMHEEAVTLLYALQLYGDDIVLHSNKCKETCGRPQEVQDIIRKIEDCGNPQNTYHDVMIVHYAFRGVCGLEGWKRDDSFVISRTMFETDGLEDKAVTRCNGGFFDQIWLPSQFNVETFKNAGVSASRITVVPEAMHTDLYDPRPEEGWADVENSPPLVEMRSKRAKFNFYTSFKWEQRKNWQGLLQAYTEEFNKNDSVALFIKTHKAWEGDPVVAIENSNFTRKHVPNMAPVHLITSRVSSKELAYLYAHMDAFVLPTHGEGWGLPTMEAMAMEMPVITTNWGGSTEFANDDNAFMIPVEKMDWAFGKEDSGMKWAVPSVPELRRLMRRVYEFREVAKNKGRQARQDVVEHFGLKPVGKLMMQKLERIRQMLPKKRLGLYNSMMDGSMGNWDSDWGERDLWEKVSQRMKGNKPRQAEASQDDVAAPA